MELKKISYYLDFRALPNVAEPIRVKGVQRRIPHDLFTQKQLDHIYQNFPESQSQWTQKKTLRIYHLVLGLRIYQGLQEQELAKLEIHHLQLRSEEHTSELQSRPHLVCRLLLEK